MHTLRTRFANDIVAECMPSQKPSQDVIIFCDGMPGLPGKKKKLMEFYAKKGYWCFNPRYRGVWESGGSFLENSPVEDIRDVIDGLFQPVNSLWDGVEYNIDPKHIIIVGGSFGGPAALLLSSDPRVNAVITVAGVVDWTVPGETEPLDWLFDVTKASFGEAFRITKKNWEKLQEGNFYNPVNQLEDIDPTKILMIHAKDDTVVPYVATDVFSQKLGIPLVSLKTGDHLSSSILTRWKMWRHIKKHLASLIP